MKKIIILLTALVLTGCKINRVECNKTEIENEIEIQKTITTELKTNKIVNMKIETETMIPEKYINQKDIISNIIKEQYNQIEETYNIKPEITEKETGTKIEFEMNEEQIKEFYNSKSVVTTTKEIIEEFENQGFTCKKK